MTVDKLITDKEIECELYNNIEMLREKFTEFNQNKTRKQTGLYKIIGYDPMNMYKMNTSILHEHFVRLRDRKSEKNLFLKGPVITIYNQDESDVIGFLTQY